MDWNVGRELAALLRMTVKQLRQKYMKVFGEETNANNKAWLVKRIAWRLQGGPRAGCPNASGGGWASWPATPTYA